MSPVSARMPLRSTARVSLGLAVGLVGALVLTLMLVPSAHADGEIDGPSQSAVDAASREVDQKQNDLDALTSQLASANARLLSLTHTAEVRAEEYNGAVWRMEVAQKETKQAHRKAAKAAERVENQRGGIVALITESYTTGSQLTPSAALLEAQGPEELLNKFTVVRAAGESMQSRFDAFTELQNDAEASEQAARESEELSADLAAQAKAARDSAANAAMSAQLLTEDISAQKDQIAQELSTAQNISRSVAAQREAALIEQAAKQGADQERARQREEARKARKAAREAAEAAREEEKRSQDQDEPDTDADDSRSDHPVAASYIPEPPINKNPPPANKRVDAVIKYAKQQLGLPYQWGANGPTSFDCSGLTMMAWAQAGKQLPHYSAGQFQVSKRIKRSDLRRGDLVFWGASPGKIHHVAIYVGNGQIIHAPRTGVPVRIDAIDYWIAPTYFARP